MNPYLLARVAATFHATNYQRGDEPRVRCEYRARRVVSVCRIIDRHRAELPLSAASVSKLLGSMQS